MAWFAVHHEIAGLHLAGMTVALVRLAPPSAQC